MADGFCFFDNFLWFWIFGFLNIVYSDFNHGIIPYRRWKSGDNLDTAACPLGCPRACASEFEPCPTSISILLSPSQFLFHPPGGTNPKKSHHTAADISTPCFKTAEILPIRHQSWYYPEKATKKAVNLSALRRPYAVFRLGLVSVT